MSAPAAATAEPRRTPLYEVHERLGAALVDFAGWLMPLRYGSEAGEHRAVREAAGLFDLSHMGEIHVRGPQADALLDHALVGHLSAVAPGRARYTMITAEDGGVLDDLIVYRLAADDYLVVANAANSDAVAAALRERASGFDAEVADESAEYALIAVQGPRAAEILAPLTDADLSDIRYYAGYFHTVAGHPVLLARTGYTGEDGFEIFLRPGSGAAAVWDALSAAGEPHGLVPAGLSARDTLRLEAGMPLYGNELTTEVTPYEAGLGRVVKLDKPGDFVGRAALAARARSGPSRTLVGLVARGRRVPRQGYTVLREDQPVGVVTSGAPSPTLGRPIAVAYVDAGVDTATGAFAVDVRGRAEPVDVVELPFYRREA
ncbi:glycine cleavage system aminomethyltransferase GcvT [Marinitenerispora sediminis]|uniref:Aminomethyltransferase n=1 Tax=Marinitenerispora sediminis TaxID=1931232 RepID=A0A368SZQ2_9ACTN|nr:glycine cleavage system aminomethyltransferase GcvT [Marinitenerispora sediminis]RCV51494.1 glycine cleavage system aminomethyltransferase GcvT [Marinitenerispora sediminis]RCV52289.1 glycine cleavage system aminomethyltransferase GcvT [Marinitenerispora sediminis]RCV58829.1 glycine cleavage system aminomethyltransferase GcvT [Marinitenerispora sediminis]